VVSGIFIHLKKGRCRNRRYPRDRESTASVPKRGDCAAAFPQASAILASLGASNVDRAFVQMLTDLARRIEIKTIAEWV